VFVTRPNAIVDSHYRVTSLTIYIENQSLVYTTDLAVANRRSPRWDQMNLHLGITAGSVTNIKVVQLVLTMVEANLQTEGNLINSEY
jgi:hypothetical protein